MRLLASGSAAAQSMLPQPRLTPQAVLARLFTAHPLRSAWFAPSFLLQVSLSQLQSIDVSLTGELGAFTAVDALAGQSFRVRFLDGTMHVSPAIDAASGIEDLLAAA